MQANPEFDKLGPAGRVIPAGLLFCSRQFGTDSQFRALVPSGTPGREDVCQDILLAFFESIITLEALKAQRANVLSFMRKFTRNNHESGGCS